MTRVVRTQARALWVLLSVVSLQDFALTALGLSMIAGSREMNPLPALAFAGGLWAALTVKVAALLLVLAVVVILDRRPYQKPLLAFLAVWCVLIACVNVFSLHQLQEAGVIRGVFS